MNTKKILDVITVISKKLPDLTTAQILATVLRRKSQSRVEFYHWNDEFLYMSCVDTLNEIQKSLVDDKSAVAE